MSLLKSAGRVGGYAVAGTIAECDASLKACAAAKVRPSYTKEECVRVLSSLHGGDLKWASKAMGPSSEGKCRLMYPVF